MRIVRGAVRRLSTQAPEANDDFQSIVRGLVARSGGRSTEREASDFLNRIVRGAVERLRAGEPEMTVFATIRNLAPPQQELRHMRGNVGELRQLPQDQGRSRAGAPEMVVAVAVRDQAPPQPPRRPELRHMPGNVGDLREEQPQRRPGVQSRDSSPEPDEPRHRRGRTR
jgi:hypothetical protein